jgi:hypothetical protein
MKSIISITNHSEAPLHVEVGDPAGTVIVLKRGESFQTDECDGLAAMNEEAIHAPTNTPQPAPKAKK